MNLQSSYQLPNRSKELARILSTFGFEITISPPERKMRIDALSKEKESLSKESLMEKELLSKENEEMTKEIHDMMKQLEGSRQENKATGDVEYQTLVNEKDKRIQTLDKVIEREREEKRKENDRRMQTEKATTFKVTSVDQVPYDNTTAGSCWSSEKRCRCGKNK